jgi:hypothetical protein
VISGGQADRKGCSRRIAKLSHAFAASTSEVRMGSIMETHKAYFMVRAQVVNESDRVKFDHWYATGHLPLAMEKLQAEKGWRFWSRSDPSVHYAFYQFPDVATLRSRIESPEFKLLVADFDAAWPHITRTRDLIEAVQET